MAKQRLEDIAIDCSRAFMKQCRKDKKALRKSTSRNLEVAINLFNYIEDTPGMSRATLAEKLNVSQAYLCRVINGNVNLTLKTIEKYEDILNIELLPKPHDEQIQKPALLLGIPSARVDSTGTFSFGAEFSSAYSFNCLDNGNSVQICSY